jgi:hypothetical protein
MTLKTTLATPKNGTHKKARIYAFPCLDTIATPANIKKAFKPSNIKALKAFWTTYWHLWRMNKTITSEKISVKPV